jgi:hypothetical protein
MTEISGLRDVVSRPEIDRPDSNSKSQASLDHQAQQNLRLKQARAENMINVYRALDRCHVDDALAIMTAELQSHETGGPPNYLFRAMLADAEWWSETAPPHEVQQYVYAGLKHLAGNAIGPNARARLLIALWNGMQPDAKRKFLAFAGGPAK